MGGKSPNLQPVLAGPSRAALFLVMTVEAGGEPVVRELLGDLAGLVRSVGFRRPEDRLSCVAGIGSQAWDRLFDGPRPAGLHPFVPLRGARHTAPSTPGDLVFHVRAQQADLCFELGTLITRRMAGAVRVVDEVQGFTYFDQRDLLGFVDGTENPEGNPAVEAVYVGEEDPAFAGGSYLIVQKYLHDLDGWDRIGSDEQERVIGRTKLSDVELPDGVQAPDSHVAVNQVLDEDGEERQIHRANMPFGSPGRGEYGTYFAGYCRTPEVTEQMLRNMFLGTDEASHDRILDFSTAVTGSLFHVPTADFLEDGPSEAVAPSERRQPEKNGSLGIGSLKSAPVQAD
ncbi:Dyp-type peroxidase [Kitasatospora sp. NPDC051853]|uniref:Dyp-type peroxidase n=1 Tax=Kitasatospora sp. NPDC051853 TaxID=3364058 RepID=UPI003794C181